MNEWDVFMAIASVVGFAAVLLPPVTRLNGAIARLTVTVEHLGQSLGKLEQQNHKSHTEIRGRLDGHTERLNGHEKRIVKLESKHD